MLIPLGETCLQDSSKSTDLSAIIHCLFINVLSTARVPVTKAAQTHKCNTNTQQQQQQQQQRRRWVQIGEGERWKKSGRKSNERVK